MSVCELKPRGKMMHHMISFMIFFMHSCMLACLGYAGNQRFSGPQTKTLVLFCHPALLKVAYLIIADSRMV